MTESTSSSEIKDLDIAVLKQVERDIEASKKKRHSAPIRSIHPAKRHSQPPEESERRYSNKRISVLSAFSVLSTASSTSSIHLEPHFDSPEIVRDVIIGLSDGLTVPFALAAGLASLNNSRLVVTAGFAEIIAGAISMGLGGYLAGKSEIEHYDNERKREETEVELVPYREEEEIFEVFEPYGVNRDECQPIIERLKTDHVKWVDFMMKFELGLEKPSARRTWVCFLKLMPRFCFDYWVFIFIWRNDSTAALLLYSTGNYCIVCICWRDPFGPLYIRLREGKGNGWKCFEECD